MKTFAFAGLALASVVCASPVLAARTNFKAEFDGDNPAATGTGAFTFDDGTKVLCGKVTYDGLAGGQLTSGALKNANDNSQVKPLTVGPSPLTISVVLNEAEAALLTQDPGPGLYIALGNAMYPAGNAPDQNGELNGELLADNAGVDQCPVQDGGVDGGADAAADAGDGGGADPGASSSGAPGSSSGGAPSGGSSSGDSDPLSPDDAPAASEDHGGCSTTGTASTGGAFLAGIVALMLARRSRRDGRAS